MASICLIQRFALTEIGSLYPILLQNLSAYLWASELTLPICPIFSGGLGS